MHIIRLQGSAHSSLTIWTSSKGCCTDVHTNTSILIALYPWFHNFLIRLWSNSLSWLFHILRSGFLLDEREKRTPDLYIFCTSCQLPPAFKKLTSGWPMFNMCKTFNVLPNIFVLGEIKTVAMFNYSFFEKLAQSYFCDGVIHVSAGSSWIQYFFFLPQKRENKTLAWEMILTIRNSYVSFKLLRILWDVKPNLQPIRTKLSTSQKYFQFLIGYLVNRCTCIVPSFPQKAKK